MAMISTKGRYALRMMIDLTQHLNEGNIALKDIAQRQEISKKYLEQIIPALSRAGMLLTEKGARGGYRLASRPEEITVGDILRATEGNVVPVSCLEKCAAPCERRENCLTLPMWSGLDRVVNEYLDSISLQDLVSGNTGNDYVI